ncbi:acyl carrier protein [Achromobacter insuavis]|uniref:acyl carrier protein n=1 Tax=Achromobacter insuavis TaxID=1287735 RepID=UPI001F12E141|nr:acyl carrier protein [Achromobacter insuavis]
MSTQTITDTDTEAEVIAWLKENRNAQVEGIKEKNLIEERILDSMQFLDFIMFLGELAGHDVSTAITVDDLRTVDAIVNFVQAQR